MWGARIGDRIGDRIELRYTLMTVTAPGTVVRAHFQPAGTTGKRECFDGRVT
jgi:hypothetical protein